MDLEKRVEALEQELQILKNQIQATLLDIQEQLLTNTHPALRAENSNLPGPPAAGQAPAVQTISAQAADPEFNPREDTLMTPPGVRQVRLDDLAGQNEGQSPVRSAQQRAAQPGTDWSSLAELEDWATQKLEKLGPQRTRELIHMYAEKGRFSDDEKDALLHFVRVAGGRVNPETRQGSQPRPKQGAASAAAAQPAARESRPTPNGTAKRRPANGSGGNSNGSAQRQRPASPAQPRPNGSAANARPPTQRPSPPAARPPAPPQPEEADDEDDGNKNVVLRLIAGVHNAGAGVKWRKQQRG